MVAAGVVSGQFRLVPHDNTGCSNIPARHHPVRGAGQPAASGKEITGTRRLKGGLGSADPHSCNDVLLQTGIDASTTQLGRTILRTFPDATPGKCCHLNSLHQATTDPPAQLGKGAGIYPSQHITHMTLHPPGGEASMQDMHASQQLQFQANAMQRESQLQEAVPVIMRDRSLYDKLVARSHLSAIW